MGVTTKNSHCVFVTLSKPDEKIISLTGVEPKIVKAKNVANGHELKFKQQPEGVFIYLENISIDSIDTIIELEKKQ